MALIPVNRKLGKFEIIRKLARGGMADVYLGRNEESGQTVALKLIERAADPDTLDSIEAERRGCALQARLAAVDPRVVPIYETGDLDEYFYVAMEYIEGQDLAEIIRPGPIPVLKAVETGIAICETLDHAHTLEATIDGKAYHGIVHGDIKPRNIRIDSQGRVRLLDFGIAKALSLSRRLTRNEFGSVQYASPERLETGEVDWMCDLWSVGVVLYEMITGIQPYQAASTERLERMIRSRIPPPPAPDPCPEPLRRLLVKALAPDPSRRYQSAAEFAADLARFRDRGDGPPGEAVDLQEITRRTFRPESAPDESTRRTVAQVHDLRGSSNRGSANHEPAPPAPPAKPKRKIRRIVFRTLGLLLLATAIYTGYQIASTYLLWKHGQQLESEINAENLTDPDRIWDQWTELSKGRSSSLVLYGPRRSVKHKLAGAADNVIVTYRNNEAQPVFQKDWERARSYLAKALTVDPGDDSVRGKLRLCEGHIARINGTTHRTLATLNQAAAKFYEAQQLMPKSPDPQLGLARLYVYGLRDIDKAYNALQEAERRGYHLGNREKGQLADGYRDRGDRLWSDSSNVRGLPQEKDQVEKAADDYKRALLLYQEIAPFGNASANIARVQGSLDGVEDRVRQLRGGFKLWP